MARLLIILCAVVRVSLGAAGSALSANGRYAVELSRTPEDKLLVTVFQVAKDQKTLSWSRAVEWQPTWSFYASVLMIFRNVLTS